jgi:hypothetical protein
MNRGPEDLTRQANRVRPGAPLAGSPASRQRLPLDAGAKQPSQTPSSGVRFGIRMLEFKPDAGSPQVGMQRSATRFLDAVEEQTLDAHVIVEALDMRELRHGKCGVEMNRRAAVRR